MAVLLDGSHVTVEKLRHLLPGAYVVGGSFEGALPDPRTLPPEQRHEAFVVQQRQAKAACLQQLLAGVGLPKETEVPNGEGGERIWPIGFVGSMSDKGTVVLGAIARAAIYQTIGIDVEFLHKPDFDDLKDRAGSLEGLLTIPPEAGVLLAFSAKEAVFKAQYPVCRKKLDHADVKFEWKPIGEGFGFDAKVTYPGALGLRVFSEWVHPWLVSVAVPAKEHGGRANLIV